MLPGNPTNNSPNNSLTYSVLSGECGLPDLSSSISGSNLKHLAFRQFAPAVTLSADKFRPPLKPLSPLRGHVSRVVAVGAKPEVTAPLEQDAAHIVGADTVVSDTVPHVARMQPPQTILRRTGNLIPGNMVGEERGFPVSHDPVAIGADIACPEPTVAELRMAGGQRALTVSARKESLVKRRVSVLPIARPGAERTALAGRGRCLECLPAPATDRMVGHRLSPVGGVAPPVVPATRGLRRADFTTTRS